jgi:hypothetical protein
MQETEDAVWSAALTGDLARFEPAVVNHCVSLKLSQSATGFDSAMFDQLLDAKFQWQKTREEEQRVSLVQQVRAGTLHAKHWWQWRC